MFLSLGLKFVMQTLFRILNCYLSAKEKKLILADNYLIENILNQTINYEKRKKYALREKENNNQKTYLK